MGMKTKVIVNLPTGKKIFSFENEEISIGRSKLCDIRVNDGHLSRIHFKIKRLGSKLLLVDQKSTNGTLINEKRVEPGAVVELGLSDQIRFGETSITLTAIIEEEVSLLKTESKKHKPKLKVEKVEEDVTEIKELLKEEKADVDEKRVDISLNIDDIDEVEDFDDIEDFDDLDDLDDISDIDELDAVDEVDEDNETTDSDELIEIDCFEEPTRKIEVIKEPPVQSSLNTNELKREITASLENTIVSALQSNSSNKVLMQEEIAEKIRLEVTSNLQEEMGFLKNAMSEMMNSELGKVLDFNKELASKIEEVKSNVEKVEENKRQCESKINETVVPESPVGISRGKVESVEVPQAFSFSNDHIKDEIKRSHGAVFSYDYHVNPGLKYNSTLTGVNLNEEISFSGNRALATQIKNTTQVLEDNLPEITVNPEEILRKAQEELEIDDIDRLHIEQQKIEAKVVALKLIQDAELEAQRIQENTKQAIEEQKQLFKIETEEIRSTIDVLKEEYTSNKESFDNKISDLNRELDTLKKEKQSVEDEILNILEKIDLAKESLDNNNEKILEVHKKIEEKETEYSLRTSELENNYKTVEKELQENEKELNYKLRAIKGEIESNNKIITLFESQRDSLNQSIEDLSRRENKKQEDVDVLDGRIHQLYLDRENLENEVAKDRTVSESLKQEVALLSDKVESLGIDIADKKAELADAKHKLKVEFEKERDQLGETIAQFREEYNEERKDLYKELEDYRVETIETAERDAKEIVDTANALRDEANREFDETVAKTQSTLHEHEEKLSNLINEIEQRNSECDEYVRETRSSVEQEVADLREAVQSEVEQIRETAKNESQILLEKAESDYETKISRANLESEKILSAGKKKLDGLVEKANSKKNEIINEANEKREQILNSAEEQKEAIVADAHKKAYEVEEKGNKLFQESTSKAERIIKESQQKALEIQEKNLKDIKTKKAQVEKEVVECESRISQSNERVEKLNQDFDDIKNNMQKEQARIRKELENKISERKEEAERLYNEKVDASRNEAVAIVAKAKKEYEDNKKELEAKLSVLKDETLKKIDDEKNRLTAEFKAKMVSEKKNLAMLRAQETENLNRLRSEAQADIEKSKSASMKAITDSVQKIVLVELKSNIRHELTAAETRSLAKSISNVVKDSFKGTSKGGGFLDKVSPYGKVGEGKSKKFWIKAIIVMFVVLGFVVTYFIKPEFYTTIQANISSFLKVDNSAQKLFIDKVKEDRKKRPKFDPKQTTSFKGTYTANVLYTKDFAKNWLSDDFQAEWTIKADALFVNDLGLPETKVVAFISEEFKLIRDLQDIRNKIRLETKTERFKEMRELEESRVKKLKLIIGSNTKYQKIRDYQKILWK